VAACERALSFPRAEIFNADVTQRMHTGFTSDVINFIAKLYDNGADRPEDVAGVAFRRANFFGYGQAWLDRFGFNVMPLGQNPVVHGVMGMDLRRRRGGAFYRDVIRRTAPDLARFPLSKGSLVYPFGMPGFVVPAYSAFLKRWRPSTPPSTTVWSEEREFVFDLIGSETTRTFSGYDMQKIEILVEEFFGGKPERGAELDWFLSFELWRLENSLR
jgi:hypothetical protein